MAHPSKLFHRLEPLFAPGERVVPGLALIETVMGKGVVATRLFPAGSVVGRFWGRVLPWHQIPYLDRAYVMPAGRDFWTIPEEPERYINHSCEPNLRFGEGGVLTALRDIAPGEEIYFAYDVLPPGTRGEAPGPDIDPSYGRWDHAFTFRCLCGAPSCRGVIDRNRRG